ncbi:hypothetical protein OUZ56_006424 [Daphnia magna]|uniref:Uncharacterized protein n=1 Tax=Daphnia magna TaxID=35525 RepID=A0ABQ9YVN7_9CRUS|nr:hypothetical protein OUZ56_006424 [Daphnia magna]
MKGRYRISNNIRVQQTQIHHLDSSKGPLSNLKLEMVGFNVLINRDMFNWDCTAHKDFSKNMSARINKPFQIRINVVSSKH